MASMIEQEESQKNTKKFSRERFKKVMGRSPLTWQEGTITTFLAGTGAAYGLGYGYVEVLKSLADSKEIIKPLVEGVVATLGGASIGGALGTLNTAYYRGWGETEEPFPSEYETDARKFRELMKESRGGIIRNAIGWGGQVGIMAAGEIALAIRNDSLAEKLLLAQEGSLPVVIVLTSFPRIRKRKEISNGK